ncbi:MAG: hypothetical protein ACXIVD_12895 [Salinarimonas sp.]
MGVPQVVDADITVQQLAQADGAVDIQPARPEITYDADKFTRIRRGIGKKLFQQLGAGADDVTGQRASAAEPRFEQIQGATEQTGTGAALRLDECQTRIGTCQALSGQALSGRSGETEAIAGRALNLGLRRGRGNGRTDTHHDRNSGQCLNQWDA